MPARYAQSAPWRKEVRAAATISVSIAGMAVPAAPRERLRQGSALRGGSDFGGIGGGPIAAAGRRVAGGQQRPEGRLHDRPAEVSLKVRRARRHAGSLDRHRPGQGVRARVPARPDAGADQRVRRGRPASRKIPSVQSTSMVRKPATRTRSQQEGDARPAIDELGRPGRPRGPSRAPREESTHPQRGWSSRARSGGTAGR